MNKSAIFEDFSAGPGAIEPRGSAQSDPLEGFEAGYKAGWDDAVAAQQGSQAHLSTVLAQNLEQAEFTLIEAQTEVLKSVKPVLNEITATLLPGLSSAALRALISEEIS
ncbi:MAG: hypothetical protein WBC85_04650, partial [Planktotalea sp.]